MNNSVIKWIMGFIIGVFVVIILVLALATGTTLQEENDRVKGQKIIEQNIWVQEHKRPDIIFFDSRRKFYKGFGYYMQKEDGTKYLLVIGQDGGIQEISL